MMPKGSSALHMEISHANKAKIIRRINIFAVYDLPLQCLPRDTSHQYNFIQINGFKTSKIQKDSVKLLRIYHRPEFNQETISRSNRGKFNPSGFSTRHIHPTVAVGTKFVAYHRCHNVCLL